MIHWAWLAALYLWAGYWLAVAASHSEPGEKKHPTWAVVVTAVIISITWAVLFPIVLRRKERALKKGK